MCRPNDLSFRMKSRASYRSASASFTAPASFSAISIQARTGAHNLEDSFSFLSFADLPRNLSWGFYSRSSPSFQNLIRMFTMFAPHRSADHDLNVPSSCILVHICCISCTRLLPVKTVVSPFCYINFSKLMLARQTLLVHRRPSYPPHPPPPPHNS